MIPMSYQPVIPDSLYQRELQRTLTKIELLKVNELKLLCKSMGLLVTGKKSVLQDRIKQFLDDKLMSQKQNNNNSNSNNGIRDLNGLTAVKFLLNEIEDHKGSFLPSYQDVCRALQHGGGTNSFRTLTQKQKTKNTIKIVQRNPYAHTIHFKESPFYRLKKLIPESPQKVLVTNGKSCCTIRFNLSSEDFNLLQRDQRFKLYLLSGMLLHSQGLTHKLSNSEDIQFPSPYELRMNQQVIKDNIKGIKNKRGTSKPANLTPYLTRDNSTNLLELYYACTLNEYLLYIYIVETISPETLLQQILRHPKILRAATLYYLRKTQSEEANGGIETTATILSLQCPISYTRMKYPAKSIRCQHLQCFDALWFLHSQLQIPTWQCPVCQVSITLDQLAICEYVDDILCSCGEEVEQVELFADGSWKPYFEENDDNVKDGKKWGTNSRESQDQSSNITRGETVGDKESGGNESVVVISLDSDDEADNDHTHIKNFQLQNNCTPPTIQSKQHSLFRNNQFEVKTTTRNPFLTNNRQSGGDSPGSTDTLSSRTTPALSSPGSNSVDKGEVPLPVSTTNNTCIGNTAHVSNPFLTKRTTPIGVVSSPTNTTQTERASPYSLNSDIQSPLTKSTTTSTTTTESVVSGHPAEGCENRQSSNQKETSQNSAAPHLPPLPDLPPLRSYSEQLSLMRCRTIKGMESAGSSIRPPSLGQSSVPTSPPRSTEGPIRSVSGLGTGSQKPIVAPFIPRRSYSNSNHLPKKRNLFFSSIGGDPTST